MTKVLVDIHVGLILLCTLTVYVVPAVNPLNVVEHCQVVPLMLYSRLVPTGDVTTIVPVVTVQVGCVRLACGIAGAPGIALITKFAVEMHVMSTLVRTLIVYVVPAVKPLNVFELCQIVPLMLYSRLVPTGDVTTIVPVVTVQVGCVRLACGIAGALGTALTINEDNVELQLLSETLLTVRV
jgi:hypothetical protein